MSLVGADVDALRALAATYEEHAGALDATRTTITGYLEQAQWVGVDAEEFREQWYLALEPAMARASADLGAAAATLRANADQQEAASAAGDVDASAGPIDVGGSATSGPVTGTPAIALGVAPVPSDPVPGKPSPIAEYESALRDAGLLPPRDTEPLYWEWLENAKRQGVDADVIVEIAKEFDIGPEDFEVLSGMTPYTDPDGKTFFLLPKDISADDARKATLMTYIFNAGTDYGEARGDKDFPDTPYSAEEVQRIIDRQDKNGWSYSEDVAYVHNRDGRLLATPNGLLMGVNGNPSFSRGGGTTWGDIFMLNIDETPDPVGALRDVVKSGLMNYQREDGSIYPSADYLDLDRVLHHEEQHSQQWAKYGRVGFGIAYLEAEAAKSITKAPNKWEIDAGLSDGGYE